VLAAVWVGVLSARLYDLQIVRRDHFRSVASRQQLDIVELEPPRGTIYDRRGRELAVSVTAESLYADPAAIESPAEVAERLAPVLGLDTAELIDKLDSERSFVWIRRKLDPPVASAVRELDLPGLGFVDESKRYYPFRRLAGQLLGFVGTDHTGLAGLEAAYDRVVAGRSARRTVLRDAYRQALMSPEMRFPEPEPGSDLHLTVDSTIQHIAERELAAAVEAAGARGGSVVVMDPWTGAVLAMASLPSFDPNRFADVDPSHWRIRPISDVFEPGSTFKAITVAAALEAHLVDPNDLVDCEQGAITVNRMRIRDHHPYGELTVRQVLAKSSNVGAIKIGMLVGRERLDSQVRSFGFGRRSGIDLPGESAGLLTPLTEQWSTAYVYTSFGHGLAVTSLQLTNAFAAVANGGVLHRPYVVEAIGRDGGVEPIPRPVVLGRVLHPATALSLERLLEEVVENGTAGRAKIAGYRVAGKTGTPQKLAESGGYSDSRYMASFVGFAPARRPAVVCLVLIDEPRDGAEGGVVAAPVFAAVVGAVLNYLKVPPEEPPEPAWPGQTVVAAETEEVVPAAVDDEGGEPTEELAAVDLPVGGVGEAIAPSHESEQAMPDLAGLTARQALVILGSAGFTPRLHGSGFVVRQQPAAGTPYTEVDGRPELWLSPSVS
ncbi:MAG: penicillin-binding transpeptidase domain-containing protein, partial [Thermoanaerobaculia bacterium]|nr:penicillin-binding transpeptidase domain-containing protein [Thermoanaerobaculia bacterium]